MKLIEFFQGPEGENSSKRLAGLSASFVFLVLSMAGGILFLKRNDARSFLDLLDSVSMFAIAGLGLGIFDVFFKKRYDKNNLNSSSS